MAIDERNRTTQLEYCKFLLVSQINYTQTHFAAHSQQLSHDQVNRYLRGKQISSRQVWDSVAKTITQTMDICCDDTGLINDIASRSNRPIGSEGATPSRSSSLVPMSIRTLMIFGLWIILSMIHSEMAKPRFIIYIQILKNAVFAKALHFSTILVGS